MTDIRLVKSIYEGSRVSALGEVDIPNMVCAEWYGAKGDGVTDDTDALNEALATGKTVFLGSSTHYKITDTLTLSAEGTRLISFNGAEIRQVTSNKGGIAITASNHEINGIVFRGPQYAIRKTGENAIYVHGVDAAHYITGSKIKNCQFINWGYCGILAKYVSHFDWSGNRIWNIYTAGISGSSVSYSTITKNEINNIVGTAPAYGIALTRANNDSLVTEPRSSEVTVSNNVVRNVTNWEGLDTHGGENITFSGNVVTDCYFGIAAGPANNTAGTVTFAPLNVNIIGNVIDSGKTDGTAHSGIVFVGAGITGTQYGTGSIIGNTIKGHGLEAVATGNALNTYTTEGLVISGNSFIDCGTYGIYITAYSLGTVITGNAFYDVWSNTTTAPIAIRSVGTNNTLTISGNSFTKGDNAATYSCVEAIRIGNTSGTSVRLGQNFNNGYTRYLNDAGDKANRGTVGGLTTSGTGEDDLDTTSLPANTIGDQGRIRVYGAGTKTGAGGNKTLKFYFGASSVTFHAAANNTNDWRFEAVISNNATNSQSVSWLGWDGATPLQGYEVFTIDTTAAVTMKITGECANGADTITQGVWHIEHQ
jgi:hypothetical protein